MKARLFARLRALSDPETAAVLAEKQELTAGEAAEVSQLWRKLVKLFHPDRFADGPEKQET